MLNHGYSRKVPRDFYEMRSAKESENLAPASGDKISSMDSTAGHLSAVRIVGGTLIVAAAGNWGFPITSIKGRRKPRKASAVEEELAQKRVISQGPRRSPHCLAQIPADSPAQVSNSRQFVPSRLRPIPGPTGVADGKMARNPGPISSSGQARGL